MKRKTRIKLGVSINAFMLAIVIGVIIYGALSTSITLQLASLVLLTFLVVIIFYLLVALAIWLLFGGH